ncbi:MAG TPA: alpha/beta fold hydrolase [Cyclobacteriaceae bacterium]|nr:alpha/beta fold hydrolase [Cyclobacteriaceae bacterium]
MPVISNSAYTRNQLWLHAHRQTILPSMFRKIEDVDYTRERITLPDEDFLDIDRLKQKQDKLIIISHGLEGSSERHYVKGMAKYFFKKGWDVLAWNCRSCSGEINKAPRLYHHAATHDLESVIDHARSLHQYKHIALTGFSMGGSLTLKYLGERNTLPAEIKSAVVFSVPCNLGASAAVLDKSQNSFYRKGFLKKLKYKIKLKAAQYPALFDLKPLQNIKYFEEFDDIYTAPRHGFQSAQHFYETASANRYIPQIKTGTLIVNAQNDPFLPETCYPYELATNSEHVFLECPPQGGHVGFGLAGREENYMETRAFQFIDQNISNY